MPWYWPSRPSPRPRSGREQPDFGFGGLPGLAVVLSTVPVPGGPGRTSSGSPTGPNPARRLRLHFLATSTSVPDLHGTVAVRVAVSDGAMTVGVNGTRVLSVPVSVSPNVRIGFAGSTGATAASQVISGVTVSAGGPVTTVGDPTAGGWTVNGTSKLSGGVAAAHDRRDEERGGHRLLADRPPLVDLTPPSPRPRSAGVGRRAPTAWPSYWPAPRHRPTRSGPVAPGSGSPVSRGWPWPSTRIGTRSNPSAQFRGRHQRTDHLGHSGRAELAHHGQRGPVAAGDPHLPGHPGERDADRGDGWDRPVLDGGDGGPGRPGRVLGRRRTDDRHPCREPRDGQRRPRLSGRHR